VAEVGEPIREDDGEVGEGIGKEGGGGLMTEVWWGWGRGEGGGRGKGRSGIGTDRGARRGGRGGGVGLETAEVGRTVFVWLLRMGCGWGRSDSAGAGWSRRVRWPDPVLLRTQSTSEKEGSGGGKDVYDDSHGVAGIRFLSGEYDDSDIARTFLSGERERKKKKIVVGGGRISKVLIPNK